MPRTPNSPERTCAPYSAGSVGTGRSTRRASFPCRTRSSARASDSSDIVVPIETPDGRAIEITVHKMSDDGTVMVIQDVTERRNAQREINRMARFDSVTELPNRRCFEEELALALRRDERPERRPDRDVSRPRRLQAGQRQSRPPHRRQASGRDREPAQRSSSVRAIWSRAGAATNSSSFTIMRPANWRRTPSPSASSTKSTAPWSSTGAR